MRGIEGFLPSQPAHTGHCANGKIQRQADEDAQCENLKGDSRNENVVACVGVFVLMGSGTGDSAPCCLEEEGEDVARDEDARIRKGGDAGILGTEGGHDAGEGEVEACGEEGGSDREADDLDKVGVLKKGSSVVVLEMHG